MPTETKTVISLFLFFCRKRFRDFDIYQKTIHVRNEKKCCVSRIRFEDSSPRCLVFGFSIFRPEADFIAFVCSIHSSLYCQTFELKGFVVISTGLRARSRNNCEPATSEDQTLLLDREKQQHHSNFGLQPRQASVPQK
jgi:hypothetical protein